MIKSLFIITLFFFINSGVICSEINNLFNEANDLFLKKNYESAIKLYESIIDRGYENSSVFYNLGNSYFRVEKIGQAIWAYRNAIRLKPRDIDIAHNLKVAEAYRADLISKPPILLIHDIYRKIKSSITIYELFFLGGFLLFITSIIWSLRMLLKLYNRFFNSIFQYSLFITLIVHIFILDVTFDVKNKEEAVVVNKVNVLSGPYMGDNKVLFQINEGTIVEILQMKEDWYEIILLDGKKGWVLSDSLRK